MIDHYTDAPPYLLVRLQVAELYILLKLASLSLDLYMYRKVGAPILLTHFDPMV